MEEPEPEPELNITKDLSNPRTKTGKKIYVCSNDPRLNYTFMKQETAVEDPSTLEIIPRDRFDYGVILNKGEKETEDWVGTLDECVPISYAQIKDPKQGEEWYRHKYPNLPEEFYGVIARYTWGTPMTKKTIKNERKKYEKKDKPKGKPAPQGLWIKRGKITLKFD
tara:strand:- start:1 stop:498 length:498 start_codon:yes stop_codon:yes gene_type:complete